MVAIIVILSHRFYQTGSEAIPWLGDFRQMGTMDEASPNESPQFPIKPDKRSYSQNSVVWIKESGLHSDVQKLLRQAKKLPEKTQNFYKVCFDNCTAFDTI